MKDENEVFQCSKTVWRSLVKFDFKWLQLLRLLVSHTEPLRRLCKNQGIRSDRQVVGKPGALNLYQKMT